MQKLIPECVAYESLVGKEGSIVKITSNGVELCKDSNDAPIGILIEGCDQGGTPIIDIDVMVFVKAGGSMSSGDEVIANANAYAIARTTETGHVLGFVCCDSNYSVGDMVPVMRLHNKA